MCSFYLNFVNKQTQQVENIVSLFLIVSDHCVSGNHATQIWLLEVFCGSRSFGNLPDPRMSQAKCFARICSQAWTKEENKWVHIIHILYTEQHPRQLRGCSVQQDWLWIQRGTNCHPHLLTSCSSFARLTSWASANLTGSEKLIVVSPLMYLK